MAYDAGDVYHQPEKFDLVPVTELSFTDEAYEFDFRVVWKHEPSGRLLTARDAGCSCPSPFEDYCSLELLDDVDLAALEAEIRQHRTSGYGSLDPVEARDFLAKVRAAMVG